MDERYAARLQRKVSVIGLGTWQLGADWGEITDELSTAILAAAVDSGVTFIDTADVYGDGRSERLIGKFISKLDDNARADILVATKFGRRAPQRPAEFTLANFREWADRSRANLGVDRLDLVQLHCPPAPVFSTDAVYDALDTLVDEQRIARYGVSVETCEEAITAIARPHVASVQIILNVFRRKPLESVLPAAKAAGVAVIARVPLASGLLAGRYRPDSVFPANDHRNYNVNGEAFDVGETFSGVNFASGVQAAGEFARIVPLGMTAAQAALRWVVQQDGVTCVIPGARTVAQAQENAAVALAPRLDEQVLKAIEDLYDRRIRAQVHHRW